VGTADRLDLIGQAVRAGRVDSQDLTKVWHLVA
jgi:hypothetical protein